MKFKRSATVKFLTKLGKNRRQIIEKINKIDDAMFTFSVIPICFSFLPSFAVRIKSQRYFALNYATYMKNFIFHSVQPIPFEQFV